MRRPRGADADSYARPHRPRPPRLRGGRSELVSLCGAGLECGVRRSDSSRSFCRPIVPNQILLVQLLHSDAGHGVDVGRDVVDLRGATRCLGNTRPTPTTCRFRRRFRPDSRAQGGCAGHRVEKDETTAVAAPPSFREIAETGDLAYEHVRRVRRCREMSEIDDPVAMAHERLDVGVGGVADRLEPCAVDAADEGSSSPRSISPS